MATPARVAAQIGGAAEAGYPRRGDRRGVPVAVHLQRGADEHIRGIVAGKLTERPIGTQRAIRAGEEHVRPGRDIVFHAQFGAEAVHRFHPAGFDRRNKRGVGIEHPVLHDLAAQTEFFAIGRQQQFDGRGIEADAVVERLHAVLGIDALERHHRHEDLDVGDMARVAGEQRLDIERLVGLYDHVHPGARDIDTVELRYVVDDVVGLGDDDTAREGRGFHQRRRVFGRGPGIEIAVAVGLEGGGKHDLGDQVHEQARIQFDIGMDCTHLDRAVHHQRADTMALGAGKSEVQFARDAFFEHRQMLGPADAGLDHVQIVDALGVELRQRPRQEIGLLLVVALRDHPIARRDERIQGIGDALGRQLFAGEPRRNLPDAGLLVVAARCPLALCHKGSWLARSTLTLECATHRFNKPVVCFVNVERQRLGEYL